MTNLENAIGNLNQAIQIRMDELTKLVQVKTVLTGGSTVRNSSFSKSKGISVPAEDGFGKDLVIDATNHSGKKPSRKLSKEARKRMSEAQKKRWAAKAK
jgi:hypothetical protein